LETVTKKTPEELVVEEKEEDDLVWREPSKCSSTTVYKDSICFREFDDRNQV
jgi:hypothetical protein